MISTSDPGWSTVSLVFCTFCLTLSTLASTLIFDQVSADCPQDTLLGLDTSQIMATFNDWAV